MTNLTSKIVKEKQGEEGGGGQGGLLKLDSKIYDNKGDHYMDYLSFESENENFVRVYNGIEAGFYYIVFNRITSSVHFGHFIDTIVSLQFKGVIKYRIGWMTNSDGLKTLVINNIGEKNDINIFSTFFECWSQSSNNYGMCK